MNKKLTVLEAYKAMFYFLENLYKLTKSDDLGGVLGSMMLLEDESTADPAYWDDWLNAIKKIEKNNDIYMNLEKE
jgi:hypothetical protein